MPDRTWFHRLCTEQVTLAEYLAGGGEAVLKHPMAATLPLEPSFQLRLFDRLMQLPVWS